VTRATLALALVLALAAGLVPPVLAEDELLEPLVPELAGNTIRVDPGVRPYRHRLSVSPAYGALGSNDLFAFRVGYYPADWLGWEGSLSHNPGESVHAVLHGLSAIVRHPFSGRLQPYISGGYGMIMVSPGPAINADPVTKNALTIGGGLEIFVRNDLALRGESQYATVLGSERDRDGTVAYNYLLYTVGLVFYRTIAP
jgi:opacity protein-like surface antigen